MEPILSIIPLSIDLYLSAPATLKPVFNKIKITPMKLINIPEIAETGTYYIDTDIVEDGIPLQVEFYVVINYDYDEDWHDFNDLLIIVDCQDDDLTRDNQRKLEAQLYDEIYDYINH